MSKINKLAQKITSKIKQEELTEKLNKAKLNNPTMLNWLWEFSKKIIVGLFVIYVITYIFTYTLILLSAKYGWNISYLDTLITETNSTFKVIIGGYLIKSMAENVFKIKNNNSSSTSEEEFIEEETYDIDE